MPRVLYFLFLCETLMDLIVVVLLISFFTFADSGRSHTDSWHNNGTEGWSSGRQQRTYNHAEYDTLPLMPLIWDESLTLCTLIVAAVTSLVWVIRLQINCFSGHTLDRYANIAINAMYDALLAGLWGCSAVVQSSGDFSVSNRIDRCDRSLEERRVNVKAWALDGCEALRMSYGVTAFAAVWFSLRFMVTCLYRVYLLGREHKVQNRLCGYDDNV